MFLHQITKMYKGGDISSQSANPPRGLAETSGPAYCIVINALDEGYMETNDSKKPWDCAETFGKRAYQPDPGQAHLKQWPLKIKMISTVAPYFHKAHLMLAADCAAYSYRNFHKSLLKNRILIIGCPKFDGSDFCDKLAAIVQYNDILDIAVARMDAPCCVDFANAVIEAVRRSRKDIPVQLTTIFTEGEIVV